MNVQKMLLHFIYCSAMNLFCTLQRIRPPFLKIFIAFLSDAMAGLCDLLSTTFFGSFDDYNNIVSDSKTSQLILHGDEQKRLLVYNFTESEVMQESYGSEDQCSSQLIFKFQFQTNGEGKKVPAPHQALKKHELLSSGNEFGLECKNLGGKIVHADDIIQENEEEISNPDLNKEKEDSVTEPRDESETGESFQKDADDVEESSSCLEMLWERYQLEEQLRMEMKKIRAAGLPTISEEDESPDVIQKLKPLKIDGMLRHEDKMHQFHKFYSSYRERMRKLDILNYQKMYAGRLLQGKDQLNLSSSHNQQRIRASMLRFPFIRKQRKARLDLTENMIKEMDSDLELVYVGHMCLSWEFLHWQYEKLLDLWESDHYGMQRYNEVAGDIQQFQVLLQRFLENERFEGPRVQNYTKKRYAYKNLLQVPFVREDNGIKVRRGIRRRKDMHAITVDMLLEEFEESIRLFWRFIQADKDKHHVIQKERTGSRRVEPQDPSRLQLFSEVRMDLLKKEKKVKEMVRSGRCILRKFQKKPKEGDGTDGVLYFFSQVDLKLVARVLNMDRLTEEQLLWCSGKLKDMSFVSTHAHGEPSFLPFPC